MCRTPDEALRASLRELFKQDIFAVRQGLDHEQSCRLSYERLRFLGERLPAGSELLRDPERLLTVLEWSAVASPSLFLAATIHWCLSSGAIHEFGRGRPDLAVHVAELDRMSSFGALLVTELGSGNSHIGIGTRADYDHASQTFSLHTPDDAAQKFMPNAGLSGVGKIGVVYARLYVDGADRSVFPFVVVLRDEHGVRPGIRITALPETLGMPLDYATVSFDRLPVPLSSLLHDSAELLPSGHFRDPLGTPGDRLMRSLEVRQWSWVAAAAAAAAVTRASVSIAIRHGHHRFTQSRFAAPRPVLEYRGQQRRLFSALAHGYAMTCLVNRAKCVHASAVTGRPLPAGLAGEPIWTPGPGLSRTLGVVKAVASQTAARVAAECAQRSGALGMFTVNRFAEYQGLGHLLGPAAGDSYLIAGDAGRTMAAGVSYSPPGPVATGQRGADLSSPRTWLTLLRQRERALYQLLADQLDRADRRGQRPFEAWNNRAELAGELVDAHGTRLAMESLLTAVDAVTDSRARAAVDPLCATYALEAVAAHADWYLCEEMLTPHQVRRIPWLLTAASERIQPHARALADAFEIPDELIQAPILDQDYASALLRLSNMRVRR